MMKHSVTKDITDLGIFDLLTPSVDIYLKRRAGQMCKGICAKDAHPSVIHENLKN